jgi:hypothetical protein
MGSQSPFIGPSDNRVMSFFYWVTKETKCSYTNSPMMPKIPLSGDGMPAYSSPPPTTLVACCSLAGIDPGYKVICISINLLHNGLPILRALVKTGDSSPIQLYPCRHHILYLTVANSIGIAILHGLAI